MNLTLLLAWAAVSIPECRAAELPARLPRAEELIDARSLAAGMVAARIEVSRELEIGVAFPWKSGEPDAWVMSFGVAFGIRESLAAQVRSALRPRGAPPGTTLRLRLKAGAHLDISVERSILCLPVPVDSAAGAPAVRVSEGGASGPLKSWRAGVRQKIDADGVVQEATLQPGSGNAEVDRVALAPVYARRWRPATLDGRPIAVWFLNGKATLAR